MDALSIVVPTTGNLQKLIHAVVAIDRSFVLSPEARGEIIVSLNGPAWDAKKAENLEIGLSQLVSNVPLRVEQTQEEGLLAGRHLGLFASRGPLVAFVDDDFLVGPSWVSEVLRIMRDSAVGLCSGPAIPLWESPPPQWLEIFWSRKNPTVESMPLLSLINIIDDDVGHPNYSAFFGQNFVSRKDLILKAGGFGPDTMPRKYRLYAGSGETQLAYAIAQLGFNLVFSRELAGVHVIPRQRLSLGSVWKRAEYDGVVGGYARNQEARQSDLRDLHSRLVRATLQSARVAEQLRIFRGRKPTNAARVYFTSFLLASYTYELAITVSKRLRGWSKRANYLDTLSPKRFEGDGK